MSKSQVSAIEERNVLILQELLRMVRKMTTDDSKDISLLEINEFHKLAEKFVNLILSETALYNYTSEAMQRENERMTRLHESISRTFEKIRNSSFEINSAKKTLKTILEDCLMLAIFYQKYRNHEIILAAENIKIILEKTYSTETPEMLIKAFKDLCNKVKDLQQITYKCCKEFVSSSIPEVKFTFEQIYRLLSIASQTAKMKFSYESENNFDVSKQFCSNSMNFYLIQLLQILNIENNFENLNTCSVIPICGEFYIPFNNIIYLLRCEDEIGETLSILLSEVTSFGFYVSQICRSPLQGRIIESCGRLQEKQRGKKSFMSWEESAENIIDELETLEKILNMAILRLVFDLSVVVGVSEEHCLQAGLKLLKNTHSEIDQQGLQLQECLAEFQSYQNKLCVLNNIIASCTSNKKIAKQLRTLAQRLEMVGEDYLQATKNYSIKPNDVTTLYHLRLVREEWSLIEKSSLNLLLSVIDVVAFLQLSESKMNETVNDIEDQMQENKPELLKLPVTRIVRYSRASLTISKVFLESEAGRNGRKALRMSRDQIVCATKTLILSFERYCEYSNSKETAERFLVHLNALVQTIHKLLSMCVSIETNSLFETQTESSQETNETVKESSSYASAASLDRNEMNSQSLEFGLTDILEELSVNGTFTVLPNKVNNLGNYTKSLKASTAERFEDMSESIISFVAISEEDLKQEKKQLQNQVKALRIEVERLSGFPELITISFLLCDYIYEYTQGNICLNQNAPITCLLKRAICVISNTRVLYELSSLMQYFEIVSQQIDVVDILDNVTSENKVQVDNIMIIKSNNLLKQLIKTLNAAQEEEVIKTKINGHIDLIKKFRTLGFYSSIGAFNEDK